MAKITCSSCGKQLQIDESKLPMKEVKFPCPHCKNEQIFDRRKTEAGAASDAETAPAVAAHAATPAAAHAAPGAPPEDDEDRFNLPGAVIVGKDVPGLRDAAKAAGFAVAYVATAEEAREHYYKEYPKLVFIAPQQLTPPPLQDMGALMSIGPVDRRKGFFVLVADNLKTNDGNAAFLYSVNLVLATKDIGSFKKVYRDAHTFYERQSQHFHAFLEGR